MALHKEERALALLPLTPDSELWVKTRRACWCQNRGGKNHTGQLFFGKNNTPAVVFQESRPVPWAKLAVDSADFKSN